MPVVGLLALNGLLGCVTSALTAFSFSALWRWLVAPQYGDGPTMRAWFGIVSMVLFLAYLARARFPAKGGGDAVHDLPTAGQIAEVHIMVWAVCLGLLATRWVTALALGWTL